LPVFASWSDLSLSQVKKYAVHQNKSAEIKERGIKYALSMEGIVENPPGSNSGKYIDDFLGSVNLNPGNEWCVSFCQWAYKKAATDFKVKLNLLCTGHSITLFNYAANTGIRLNGYPERGDWIIFQRGNLQKGHCGIVLEINGKIIKTIEGNVSSPELNNQGVFLREHRLNNYGWLHIIGFIGFK
jgi:hypothetical protein